MHGKKDDLQYYLSLSLGRFSKKVLKSSLNMSWRNFVQQKLSKKLFLSFPVLHDARLFGQFRIVTLSRGTLLLWLNAVARRPTARKTLPLRFLLTTVLFPATLPLSPLCLSRSISFPFCLSASVVFLSAANWIPREREGGRLEKEES